MAKPASRTDLVNYCKRQLGAPVLEINIADEQVDDLVDDALQIFHERDYDGLTQTFLKYKITQEDIDRGRARGGTDNAAGITTTTGTASIVGTAVTFSFEENSNYLQVPPEVLGVNKIFKFDGSNTVTNNMFSVKYQLFLNDIYYWGSTEILTYAMTKRYLEDIDFALSTEKMIRFNQRSDRLYLDIDWASMSVDDYIIIDCYRLLDPDTHTRVWNDSFLKRYLTALMKRQWGQNLIKFQGVKLPGGIELNGRQIYDDAEKELEIIREQMSNTYELPPYDMIG
jgi:hypothetical protein